MANNATEMIGSLEDQVLETVRQSQDAVVKAVRSWADAGKNLVPELPPLPFSEQIPGTVDLVEHAFDFADRLLAAQREFAAAVLDAAKPLLGTADARLANGRSTTAKKSSS
ncbi:MAG: hypothetical protein ACRDY7_16570 [Acidimicrobiia bacterium]